MPLKSIGKLKPVLVRSKIVDDAASCAAVNHVRIEPARTARFERSDPGDGLAAESIHERVILDPEGNVASRFGKHDAAPASDAQKWLRVETPLPDFVHHSCANRGDAIRARESESPLNLRMQSCEIRAEHLLIDGAHVSS
jgi:hypothetical protein